MKTKKKCKALLFSFEKIFFNYIIFSFKWSKVTESYLEKYIEVMNLFFDYIKTSNIKIRIMFKPFCYIEQTIK